MDYSFPSALILLLLVLDPLGGLPIYISVMRNVAPERRTRVALRETAIAFGSGEKVYESDAQREPFIFPLAVPLLAGPSAMAAALLLASRQPEGLWHWVGALTLAMALSGIVLLAAERIRRALGDSLVSAIEKLMGLVLTAVAVEMILAGLKRYFFDAG